LNRHATTPAKADLQYSHSQTYVGKTSSIINENLSLNDDSHVVDETIQEISEPICDEDFLPSNQLIDTVLFHNKDRAVTFNEIEGCLLFKDDLNHEVEDPYMDLL